MKKLNLLYISKHDALNNVVSKLLSNYFKNVYIDNTKEKILNSIESKSINVVIIDLVSKDFNNEDWEEYILKLNELNIPVYIYKKDTDNISEKCKYKVFELPVSFTNIIVSLQKDLILN